MWATFVFIHRNMAFKNVQESVVEAMIQTVSSFGEPGPSARHPHCHGRTPICADGSSLTSLCAPSSEGLETQGNLLRKPCTSNIFDEWQTVRRGYRNLE